MVKFAIRAAIAALAAGVAMPAFAADLQEPIVEEAPVAPVAYEQPPADVGGWYIRGDLGYHWSDLGDVDYINEYDDRRGRTGRLDGDLDDTGSLGLGVGYQVNDHFRVDLTADYWFDQDFRGSSSGSYENDDGDFVDYTTTDKSTAKTWLLLANAYVDLGTYYGFTPYVGAGIGGAHVKWDGLTNTPDTDEVDGAEHDGASSWRFAYAVMAGASYCLTDKLKLDAGYRYSHIEGGRMFQFADGNPGPGFDDGFDTHEVRGGLRYQFGGRSNCEEPAPYEPPAPEPIYK